MAVECERALILRLLSNRFLSDKGKRRKHLVILLVVQDEFTVYLMSTLFTGRCGGRERRCAAHNNRWAQEIWCQLLKFSRSLPARELKVLSRDASGRLLPPFSVFESKATLDRTEPPRQP